MKYNESPSPIEATTVMVPGHAEQVHETGSHKYRHRAKPVLEHVDAGNPAPQGVRHQSLDQSVIADDEATLGDSENHQHPQRQQQPVGLGQDQNGAAAGNQRY